MSRIVPMGEGFWNIRGRFRIAGLINVGNQCSLARLKTGDFVLLDSYPLNGEVAEEVDRLTEGGRKIVAICNLHPFHTVHVEKVAKNYPHCRLYGTSRHRELFPDLPWESENTESDEFAALFADDFDFMVPKGVQFVANNQNFHFASVLAIHKESNTLHVDDTLNWEPLPWGGRLSFHPTLRFVLEKRPGAAMEFRAWVQDLSQRCHDVRNVCTAHAKLAPLSDEPEGEVAKRVDKALSRVDSLLARHERRNAAESSGSSS